MHSNEVNMYLVREAELVRTVSEIQQKYIRNKIERNMI